MALFKYRAVDGDGKPVEGHIEEAAARNVVWVLEERGLQVSSVENTTPRWRPTVRRFSWEDINNLNDQLGVIARAGLPLAPAFSELAKDLRNPRLRRVLKEVQRDLEAGASLEEALSRHPANFPPMYLSLIRAGERTGNLAEVVQMLSQWSTRMLDVKYNVQMALAYPAMVLAGAFLLMLFLLTKVVPVFAEIFEDFGSGLPGPTQFLVDVSAVVTQYEGGFLLLGPMSLAAVVLGYILIARTSAGRYWLDWLREKLPVVGPSLTASSTARFSRSLGFLLSANVPVVESLDLAGAASGNAVLRKRVSEAVLDVVRGDRIADALSATGYFPHTFCWILSNSEEHGHLPDALMRLSDSYDRDVRARDRMLFMMLTPVLIVIIGFFFAFFIVSLYLPIFTLGDAISG